jgi:hypothetical protein
MTGVTINYAHDPVGHRTPCALNDIDRQTAGTGQLRPLFETRH